MHDLQQRNLAVVNKLCIACYQLLAFQLGMQSLQQQVSLRPPLLCRPPLSTHHKLSTTAQWKPVLTFKSWTFCSRCSCEVIMSLLSSQPLQQHVLPLVLTDLMDGPMAYR